MQVFVSQSLSETIFAWSSGDGNQQETGENNNHVRSGNRMDEGRRSPGACDLFSAADRQGLRRRGGRVGQAEGHLAGRPHPRQLPGKAHPGAATSATNSPNSARWRPSPRPTSSSCRTSRASIPQLKAAIKELQGKGYDIPDYPEDARTEAEKDDQGALRPRCSAAPSTRCCARAIPTAAPPAPSSSTPATTRTRWAPGRRTRSRMWRT